MPNERSSEKTKPTVRLAATAKRAGKLLLEGQIAARCNGPDHELADALGIARRWLQDYARGKIDLKAPL